MKKRFLSILFALALLLNAMIPAYAVSTGFSDVASDAWYAQAVTYVQENGLMSGVGAGRFDPNGTTSRAMFATVLYRAAGSPAVSGSDTFADTQEGTWYSGGVLWASQQGLVNGVSATRFAPNDPVSREQIATILWRHAGSPSGQGGQDFADEGDIATYASTAVDWARGNGIVNGKPGNRFDPKGNATRAEVATILQNYLTMSTPDVPDTPDTPEEPEPSVLVVYFSASGSTQRVGGYIAEALNADTFAITPAQPYTSEDLNWTTPGSRVNREHDDESLRNIELTSTTVSNWDSYDTVFIGYPIWWGIAAWPTDSFVKANDFTGKTVIPFCTSSSSGLGQSGTLLAELAGTGNWQTGQRFSSGASESTVTDWVKSLDLNPAPADPPPAQEGRSLVVYFSQPETTDPNNMTTEEDNSTVVINGQVLGNTQYMAQVIQETAGADLFRIEPQTPYPTDHTTLVAQARTEQGNNARPAIKGSISSLSDYDTIYIGYPNWWGDMPMILYTFFETYDFSGKTIIPFNTHGGSGFSNTISTIKGLEPNAAVKDGLSISRNSIQNARQEIVDWVNSLK